MMNTQISTAQVLEDEMLLRDQSRDAIRSLYTRAASLDRVSCVGFSAWDFATSAASPGPPATQSASQN